MIDPTEIDFLNYFPLKHGMVPPSAVGMEKFENLPSNQRTIFQFDDAFPLFWQHKNKCRESNLEDYYRKVGNINIAPIIRFICTKLDSEQPNLFSYSENLEQGRAYLNCIITSDYLVFDIRNGWELVQPSKYSDALDALAMQVPEDIVICTAPDEGVDFVSYVHLMSPSSWSAEWASGKSFWQIHEKVLRSNGRPVLKNPEKIVKSIIRMPTTFQRVGALSFRSSPLLDRRPESDAKDEWHFGPDQQVLLRFERQTITSFPEINSFLFTVRTYYNNLTLPKRLKPTIIALENAHKDNYPREFLRVNKKKLLTFLRGCYENC